MDKLITVQLVNEIGYAIKSWDFRENNNTQSSFESCENEVIKQGLKVYIKWFRSSDGQTGFWTPTGASLKGHLYNRSK